MTHETVNATGPLAEYARKAKEHPVILTVDGKPVAVMVAIENTDMETASLSSNPSFLALIERARSRRKAQGGVSSQEMRRRLGMD